MKRLIIAGLFCGFYANVTHANDAVVSTTGQISGSYIEQNYSNTNKAAINPKTNYEVEQYSLNGDITVPIESFKYLGISASVNGTHRDFSSESNFFYDSFNQRLTSDSKKETWEAALNLFLRNSDLGGVLVGYENTHESSRFKGNHFNGVSNESFSSKSSNDQYGRYIIGSYYLESVTISGKLSKLINNPNIFRLLEEANQIKRAAEITWYPKDNLATYASVSKSDFSDFSLIRYNYELGLEFQPEYFNSRVKLLANHFWNSNNAENISSVAAAYYFHEYAALNSTPAISVNYFHNDYDDGRVTDKNYLMFQIGFMFDNRISLKDRDRKYLFSTGHQ